MKILCISGSLNELVSNDLLNRTIFYGLKKINCKLDLVTFSSSNIKNDIYYFENIYKIPGRKRNCGWLKSGVFKMPYLLWNNIVGDFVKRPYNKKNLKNLIIQKYDLIISFCPPPLSSLLAQDIIKINSLERVRYFQYWSDPLTIGMCNEVDKLPLKRIIHKVVEKNILSKADEIVYCTPFLCEMQKILYPHFANKMRWVDVGYLDRDISSQTNITPNKMIKIGYFGAFQKKIRNILPLINSFDTFSNLQLIIRGDSDLNIEKTKFNNIDLKVGRLPYEEIEQLENECDILICLGNIKGIQIPGKLFYYTNINKPIIYIGDGFHNDKISSYLKEFNRYIICENNVESIQHAIGTALQCLTSFSLNIHDRLRPENAAANIISSSTI